MRLSKRPPGLLRVPGQSEAGAAQLVSSGSLSQGYGVSSAQQSGSVTHLRVSVLFQILFPFRLLPEVEQSSLCYTIGPCWLSFFVVVLKSFLNLLQYCFWVFLVLVFFFLMFWFFGLEACGILLP